MKETIEESAERWVFDTNGHKWSNNDDTAGDNYGSFIAGYKLAQERGYSGEDIEEYAEYRTTHVLTTQIGNPYLSIKEWFEKFKKK